MLRAFCLDNQRGWAQVLQQCAFSLNSSTHQATTKSAHEVVYLRQPRLPIDAAFQSCQDQPVEAVEELVRRRQATDDLVKKQLRHAAEYAAQYTSSKRRHLEFAVGDQVLLATTHLPLPPPLSRKLAPKWIGPLPVLAKVGNVAYRVQLPANLARLHPVFHVSLLKEFVGKAPPPREPVFETEEGAELEVERLTAHRTVRGKRQFLVQWKDYPVFESTWEPEEGLSNC